MTIETFSFNDMSNLYSKKETRAQSDSLVGLVRSDPDFGAVVDTLLRANFEQKPTQALTNPIDPSELSQVLQDVCNDLMDPFDSAGEDSMVSLPFYDLRQLEPTPIRSVTPVSSISCESQHTLEKRGLEPSVKSPSSRPTKKQRRQHSSDLSLLDDANTTRFRSYQAEQWTEKFEELCEFMKQNGHSQVPHAYPKNEALARWTKRQRYQYKLKQEGKTSTMTDERIAALNALGFVWDSHGSAWEERIMELQDFYRRQGHSNVPSQYSPNQKLATWVKCQRRQYKLFISGKRSNMTLDRVAKLEALNFIWEVRPGFSS